jgi:hypothetical protein
MVVVPLGGYRLADARLRSSTVIRQDAGMSQLTESYIPSIAESTAPGQPATELSLTDYSSVTIAAAMFPALWGQEWDSTSSRWSSNCIAAISRSRARKARGLGLRCGCRSNLLRKLRLSRPRRGSRHPPRRSHRASFRSLRERRDFFDGLEFWPRPSGQGLSQADFADRRSVVIEYRACNRDNSNLFLVQPHPDH